MTITTFNNVRHQHIKMTYETKTYTMSRSFHSKGFIFILETLEEWYL